VSGRDSQARDGAALLCQSIKCPYPRVGAGAPVREPRAGRSLLEGREPSSEAEPARGGMSPRARRNLLERVLALERGGTYPRGC
jgi:hypothetical protein